MDQFSMKIAYLLTGQFSLQITDPHGGKCCQLQQHLQLLIPLHQAAAARRYVFQSFVPVADSDKHA